MGLEEPLLRARVMVWMGLVVKMMVQELLALNSCVAVDGIRKSRWSST